MRILIISASGRAIAESARRAGWGFDVLDRFADWDLKQICGCDSGIPRRCFQILDFTQIFAFIQGNSYDAAIIAGGFENQFGLVQRLESLVRLLGPSSTDLARLQNANSLPKIQALIEESGGRFPQTERELLKCEPPDEWLQKNLAAAGGRHVSIATATGNSDQPGIDPAHPVTVFQRRISGDQVSALLVAGNVLSGGAPPLRSSNPSQSCRLIGCTRQLVGEAVLGAAPFSYCGSIGPIKLSVATARTIEAIGSAIADEFKITGIFGLDLIVNDIGVWPVDINPRITASAEIFELAAQMPGREVNQFSIVQQHVEACSLHPANFKPILFGTEMFGKAILFCQNESGITLNKADFQQLMPFYRDVGNSSGLKQFIADIPEVGTRISCGEPVLSLFSRGSSSSEIFQNLLEFAAKLRDITHSSSQ